MAVLVALHVVGACLDRGVEHLVGGAGFGLVDDLADVIEHERDGAGFAERTAGAGEVGAHRARRAVLVVGQRLDDDGDATGAVALVADLVIVLAVGAGRLLDGAVDVILRHVFRARILDGEAQAGVHLGIRQAELRGDGDFARQLGEQLGPLGVGRTLAVHDVLELGMSGHLGRPIEANGRRGAARSPRL